MKKKKKKKPPETRVNVSRGAMKKKKKRKNPRNTRKRVPGWNEKCFSAPVSVPAATPSSSRA
jgi:hypothetical protein